MNSTELIKMTQLGVLHSPREIDGQLIFKINYKIAQDQCPEYLEELILSNLNDIEKLFYKEGFMAYIITPAGDLKWKRTKRML